MFFDDELLRVPSCIISIPTWPAHLTMRVGHTRRTHDTFSPRRARPTRATVTFSSVPIDTQKLALRRLVSFHIYPQLLPIIRGHLTHLGASSRS
jgi:hypothetical protein